MKTYKIVQENEKFLIERKDKKTGNRVKVFDRDKKVLSFDTKEQAQHYLKAGWEIKSMTVGAPMPANRI